MRSVSKFLNLCIVALCLSLGVTIAATEGGYAATASWTAVAEAEGYRLYRAPGACATPGAFATVQSYGLVTSGAVPNPAANGTYCHRLTAFNAVGESPFSNSVDFHYTVTPPVAPQNLSVK